MNLPDCCYDYRYDNIEDNKLYDDECIDCGDIFHKNELINGRCPNCYDIYRDELCEDDDY